MKTQTVLKKIKLNSGIGLLVLGFIAQAHATKTCPSATCPVANDADCSTYQEQVIHDPLVGTPVTHTGVVITAPSQQNCNAECAPFSFSYSTTDQHTVSGSVTAGVSTSVSVATTVIAPASLTAGCTASYSGTGTISGSSSETTTISAGPIQLCQAEGVTWTVTGDYKTGDFSTAARIKGYYYPTSPANSPILTTTCQQATGSANGTSQYYNVSGSLGDTYSVTCN